MTFYETDKNKAARILFDAITDLEAGVTEGGAGDLLFLGISLGKVAAARDYLAATLNMPVFADEAPAEPKRLRSHAALDGDAEFRAFMVRQGLDPNSALDVETASRAFEVEPKHSLEVVR